MRLWVRTHWLFCTLLAVGAVLRGLAQVGFEPSLFFFDSFTYLQDAVRAHADTPRPVGYSVLVLRPLLLLHNLAVIPLVQHLCGLGIGALVYAVLIRRGARPWVASLGAAPVLLDAYQVQIEQMIASDAVFVAMVAAAVGLLLWRKQPTLTMVLAAGLLLGLSATVRFVGGPLVAVACLYLLFASAGRKRRLVNVVALAATAAVPLLLYSTWTFQHTGEFSPGGDSMSARTLYARAAPLADCAAVAAEGVPAYEMQLCPHKPRGQRVDAPMPYMYYTRPANLVLHGLPPGVDRYHLLRDFATRVIVNQPLDVTVAILDDFSHGFAWARYKPADSWPTRAWEFPTTVIPMGAHRFDESTVIAQFGGATQTVDPGIGTVLHAYQNIVYTRGPIFAAAIIVAAWAAVRARRSGLRAATLLVAGTGLALLGSAAVYAFSWRYQIPAITFLPWALALGATALWPWARQTRTTPEDDAAAAAATDDVAVADFRAQYGDVALAPVCIVMAAYNEADSIGDVLAALPAHVLGLGVDVVVVDDGSSDGTGTIAQAAGAWVARLDANRGQGAALRVGYRLARERGATYIVTTDADGQYDAGDIPALLRPLVEGEADFVSGSRRLGREETTDRLRSLGVRVFARVIRTVTGAPISDPANGLRAMRAELTGVVTLAQPQYQASELLIATLVQGFRVTERPTTMRPRAAGASKKGGNFTYSIQFAGVVLGTWRRERRLRRSAARTSSPGRSTAPRLVEDQPVEQYVTQRADRAHHQQERATHEQHLEGP
jgi:hypothetical protein